MYKFFAACHMLGSSAVSSGNSQQEAVKLEEYSKAAILRDEIRDVETADPVLQLELQLKSAIELQNFQVKKALLFVVCLAP